MTDRETSKARGRPSGRSTASEKTETAALFVHALHLCGLTHTDAAPYLGRSIQSVRGYASGATKTPQTVMKAMADLVDAVTLRQVVQGVEMPPAAQARREALIRIRNRSWPEPPLPTTRLNPHPRGAELDDDDLEDNDE